MKFTLVAYAVSIAAGLSQLAAVILLERRTSPEVFSELTIILGSFNLFLPLVELGMQTELVRRFAGEGARDVRPVLRLRLLMGAVAVLAAMAFGVLGGLGRQALAGLALYALAMLPAGLLLTSEALGYARGALALASSLRLARLVATAVFIAGALLLTTGPAPAPVATFWLPLAAFPLVLGAAFAWLVAGRPLPPSSEPGLGPGLRVARQNASLTASLIVGFLTMTTFATLNVRAHGADGMGAFNGAQALTTPVALLVQVLLFQALGSRGRGETRRGGRLPYALAGLAAFGGYGAVVTFPATLALVYPSLAPSAVAAYFWPLALAQVLLGVAAHYYIEAHARGRKLVPVVASAASFAPIVVLMPLVPGVLPLAATGLVLLASTAAGCLVAWRLAVR